MKSLSIVCGDINKFKKSEEVILVEYASTPKGYTLLPIPVLSNEYECSSCSGKDHYLPILNPALSSKKAWLCANPFCEVYKNKNRFGGVTTPTQPKRALLWPLFCELNGLGDSSHDVKFEGLQQSQGKVDYLTKFSANPKGNIIMRGNPGTGKTYSSLALCELFTRKNTSCIFTTQKKMVGDWLDTFKTDKISTYIDRVKNCNLLVIDDFGTGEVSPGFMSFFMDVIDTRMQWTNRGTVITTNLTPANMAIFCGQALMDRLNTGQEFNFEGPTRRHQAAL